MNGEPLYEEWFLDISSIFTVYLPTIQFVEKANCFRVSSSVSGSRYMKKIIGEIHANEKTKELLNRKMYEIVFKRMKNHFKVSDKNINNDRVFVTCLERLFEQMHMNSVLQQTYSILLGNVLTPTLREQENIIRNLQELRLVPQLESLKAYWDYLLEPNSIKEVIDQSHPEVELLDLDDVQELTEIGIALIQMLEKQEKSNVLIKVTDLENHPYINFYNPTSGHYQIVRVGNEKVVNIYEDQFLHYERYRDKLDLYIVENLISNPKIIYIESFNEKIKNGELSFKKGQLDYKQYLHYRMH